MRSRTVGKGNRKAFSLDEAAQKAVLQSAVLSLFAWLVFGLFLQDILLSLALGLAAFFPCFGLLLYYPRMQEKQHCMLVEADLPFCLLSTAIELKLGVSFLRALQHAAGSNGECAKQLAITVKEVKEQGASMPDALRHFSERNNSLLARRAVAQLLLAFEQGGKNAAEPIKRIATEILARQRIESRLFSGKMVVFSLLFIAVSAVVPALFQSFSIVGSVVLQMQFTALQLFLIITAGFPLMNLMLLFYIRSKTPVFLRC